MTEEREEYIVLSEHDALKIAIVALKEKAERLQIASRMVLDMPGIAPQEARRDHTERRRLLAAMSTIKRMEWWQ